MPDGIYCIPAAMLTKGMATTSTPPTRIVRQSCRSGRRGTPMIPATSISNGSPKAERSAASVQGGKTSTLSAISSGDAPKPAADRISRIGVGMAALAQGGDGARPAEIPWPRPRIKAFPRGGRPGRVQRVPRAVLASASCKCT